MRARDNPFRTERILEVRFRLPSSWDDLLDRWESLGRRAAIVGPHGTGKTTLIEDLAPKLRARDYAVHELRLDEEHPDFEPEILESCFRSLGGRDVILLDGAEQLGRSAWSRFERRSRAAAGLVVTCHRAGLLPTLIETRTTPELLVDLVAQLLGECPPDLRALAPRLFKKHKGNLREALRELYDRYAAVDA